MKRAYSTPWPGTPGFPSRVRGLTAGVTRKAGPRCDKLDNVFGKLRWKWTTTSGTLASRATTFAMQADGKLLLAG
jgi:hypothetical protein